MRMGLLAPVAIALCIALFIVSPCGSAATHVSAIAQDDTWTVIEYPEGQEVVVELKAGAATPEAKGTARVQRSAGETSISLDVSGVSGDEGTHQVYVVDSLGSASFLGTLTISNGAGTLNAKTALSKFMIVISPEADLNTIASETKVSLRSTVPSGFNVVARERNEYATKPESTPITAEPETPTTEPSPANFETQAAAEMSEYTPEYEVPLLGIGSLKRGASTTLRANFSSAFSGSTASVVVKPMKNGPTQIKIRFNNFKESPDGTQYLLWQVGPDNSYTQLGHLIKTAKRGESIVAAEAALSDFGLLITFENAQVDRPAGSVVATIVK